MTASPSEKANVSLHATSASVGSSAREADDSLIVAGKKFHSRLFIGTGKFSSLSVMEEAIKASKTEIVTMALRRIDIENPVDEFLESMSRLNLLFLPNTSGARSAADALRIAELCRAQSGNIWVKLEVTPNPRHLLPDGVETLHATEALVKRGFIVLPYMNCDPVLAKRLEEVGAAAVMPLGSPIGTNRGLKTIDQLRIIIEEASVPVVIDAGIGAPSHAALAMECGADAVLVNTAIATAHFPVLSAAAFRLAVLAGRKAFLSKLASPSTSASASSPLTGFLNSQS